MVSSGSRPVEPIAHYPDPISTLELSQAWPGAIWVGTRGAGLFATQAPGSPFRISGPVRQPLTDVLDVLEDVEGNLWVGGLDGLAMGILTGPSFQTLTVIAESGEVATDALALAASEHDADILYLSLKRLGVYRYDQRTQASERLGSDGGPDFVLGTPRAAHGAPLGGWTAPGPLPVRSSYGRIRIIPASCFGGGRPRHR